MSPTATLLPTPGAVLAWGLDLTRVLEGDLAQSMRLEQAARDFGQSVSGEILLSFDGGRDSITPSGAMLVLRTSPRRVPLRLWRGLLAVRVARNQPHLESLAIGGSDGGSESWQWARRESNPRPDRKGPRKGPATPPGEVAVRGKRRAVGELDGRAGEI